MTNRFPSWLKAAAFSLPVLLASVPADLVLAAEKAAAQEQQPRRTPALRNKVYEKLSAAQVEAEAGNYDKAMAILNQLRERTGKRQLNSYELANVYNLSAYLHYSWEDYDKALKDYQLILKQPDIPLAMEISTRYTVAQMLLLYERWQEGLDELNRWFAASDNPSASAFILRGQTYYQLKQYRKALADIEKAVAMTEAKGKVPDEQWLSLARYLYYETGDTDSVIDTLGDLLTYYQNKTYWLQLAHVYAENNQEDKQLSALESAYQQGLLDKESELVNLALLYLNADAPFQAGSVIDYGLSLGLVKATETNLKLLANAWRRAHEIDKAIKTLRQAASKSNQGELWVQLGNLYLDKENYPEAIAALDKGLKAGGLKRQDSAQLSLGMAYFGDFQYDRAKVAFKNAGKDKRSSRHSEQWLKYLENEQRRRVELNLATQ